MKMQTDLFGNQEIEIKKPVKRNYSVEAKKILADSGFYDLSIETKRIVIAEMLVKSFPEIRLDLLVASAQK